MSTLAPGTQFQRDELQQMLSLAVGKDTGLAARVIAGLSESGLPIEDFHLARPSLDDVFLELTGHSTADAGVTMDPTTTSTTDSPIREAPLA